MTEDGVRKSGKGPYERCWQCGHAYPRSEMVKYKGTHYCRKNGCYKDITDKIRKGR